MTIKIVTIILCYLADYSSNLMLTFCFFLKPIVGFPDFASNVDHVSGQKQFSNKWAIRIKSSEAICD